MRRYGPPSEDTGEAERRGITMQHTVGALLLSTFFGISAFATPPPPELLPTNAILRLSSSSHGVCGTGFIADNGYIVTNAHLIRSLCPADECSGLEIASAPGIGAPATPRSLPTPPRVVAVFPAFDIGFLDAALPPSPLRLGSRGAVGTAVSTLGFPGCKTLEHSSGAVVSVDPLHLITSLSGGHGSSGSPIITEQGEVVGIVDEAARFIDSLGDGPFTLRGAHLEGLLQFDSVPMLSAQLDRLASFRRGLDNVHLSARIRGSLDLIVAIEGLINIARNLSKPDEVATILAQGEGILSSPPREVSDTTAQLAESLTVDYALQHRLSVRAPHLLSRYTATLENQGRNGAHLFSSPSVPTVFDLNTALLVCTGVFLILGLFFFVWVLRVFRRPRTD